MVRALVSSPMAEWIQQLHPLRLQYEFCSDANPAMASVAALAGPPGLADPRSRAERPAEP
jgi:hypothetical protein